jgi:type III pantothenate kinase
MSGGPFLLIDAGNSRIKWALADARGALVASGVFAHESAAPDAALADVPAWSSLPAPGSAWISNVAGDTVAARLAMLIDAHWPTLPVTTIRAAAQQCGVTNRYTEPARLGSDRWAGMIGARAAYPGEHLLIATLGTATTLEALRADGVFVGGLIAPGWSLMMRSLGERTAQLPTLSATSARRLIDANPGGDWFATDTPHALSAGCLLAQTAMIERAWRDLSATWQAPVRLVLGGGAADEIALALTVPHTRHDALVLSGLALIAAAGDNGEARVQTDHP